jgi:DNA-binding response OmpR family regulator
MPRILLAEDDQRLAELVRDYLGANGFQVDIVSDGLAVNDRVVEQPPELVILDIMLPGRDGLSICRELRRHYRGPVLMLTARDSDVDQVLGFEYGADDYVIKPAEPRVLLARIQALLRRCGAPSGEVSTLSFGNLHISTGSRQAALAGRDLHLSTHDFDLLWLLATHAGQVLGREELFTGIYNRPYDGLDRSIDVRVSVLRRKLGDDPQNPARIKTVWGKGYLFVASAFD